VYVLEEDIADRGIADGDLIDGLKRIKRAEIPDFLERYDQIWAW